jgi:hypothetical protein
VFVRYMYLHYMHVCMYICMYIYVCIWVSTYVYIRHHVSVLTTNMFVHYMYVRINFYVYIYIYICKTRISTAFTRNMYV